MSFLPGEEVVCVDDSPIETNFGGFYCPLVLGQKYTVLAFLPAGTELVCGELLVDGISVGLSRPTLELLGSKMPDSDVWEITRFRKIQKRDISQALAALVGLFDREPVTA